MLPPGEYRSPRSWVVVADAGAAVVPVVTDSALVHDLVVGERRARIMRPYVDTVLAETARLVELTGNPVYFACAQNRENRRAHAIARMHASGRPGRAPQLWPQSPLPAVF